MKRLLKSAFASPIALILNLLLAYVLYFVARLAYMLVNLSYFTEGLSFSHLLELFGGGLMFDTTAIIYSNLLYILLMLFPVWAKENDAY